MQYMHTLYAYTTYTCCKRQRVFSPRCPWEIDVSIKMTFRQDRDVRKTYNDVVFVRKEDGK